MKNKISLKTILLNLDAIITGTTLTICVILVNANVIMRYFFNSPIHWAEEVVTSLFVWTVFIGSFYAYRKHSHLGVDILVNLFPKKVKAVVKAAMAVVEFMVLCMLTRVSAEYVYHLIYNRTGKLKVIMTDLLRVPKWWTGIAVPIGFGLSAICSLYFMIKGVREYMKNKREGGVKG